MSHSFIAYENNDIARTKRLSKHFASIFSVAFSSIQCKSAIRNKPLALSLTCLALTLEHFDAENVNYLKT